MSGIAVLVDAENVDAQHADTIMGRASALGNVTIVRLYGDFTKPKPATWLPVARDAGYQAMFQFSGGKGKNSTDVALAIDAMDILFSTTVESFCLVSDDRDFLPLATRLRASGKRVYAICETIDPRMRRICSETFALWPPEKKVAAPASPKLSPEEQAFMIDLVDDLCQRSGKPSFAPAVLGLELRRRNAALADRIGGQKLIKRLREANVIIEHGAGPTKTISAARAANQQPPQAAARR